MFITGGGVLARIAYGHPGGRACDFLAYWLHQEGFASLALSYPMRQSRYSTGHHPDFSVVDWGEQSAEIIALHVKAHELPRRVIVMGWSMAGRIAEPITAALRRGTSRSSSSWPPHGGGPDLAAQPAAGALGDASGRVRARLRRWRLSAAVRPQLLANLQEQSPADAGHVIRDPVMFSTPISCGGTTRSGSSASACASTTEPSSRSAWAISITNRRLAILSVPSAAGIDDARGQARRARHALMDRATCRASTLADADVGLSEAALRPSHRQQAPRCSRPRSGHGSTTSFMRRPPV